MMWTFVNGLVNFWHVWRFFSDPVKQNLHLLMKQIFFKRSLYFVVPQTNNMWKDLCKSCQPAEEPREYKQNCSDYSLSKILR